MASLRSISAEAACGPHHVMLVHDRRGEAVREIVLVSQPVDVFVESAERWPVLDHLEPLRELAAGRCRDPRDKIAMRFLGVVVGHGQQPPGVGEPAVCRECLSAPRETTP
jgi:hypothetical protein